MDAGFAIKDLEVLGVKATVRIDGAEVGGYLTAKARRQEGGSSSASSAGPNQKTGSGDLVAIDGVFGTRLDVDLFDPGEIYTLRFSVDGQSLATRVSLRPSGMVGVWLVATADRSGHEETLVGATPTEATVG